MIRKVFLQDWGIYEAWESPEFHTITDIYAANAAGKSTLLDAMTVGLGLGEKHHLFEKRTPEHYQRRKGQPAYILLHLDNPLLASKKRRWDAYGEVFSVLAKIDATGSPQVHYQFFDGATDLEAAKALAQRKKWLRPTDYDEQWKRRGVNKDQRRQRIFKVGDTDKVRTSGSEELHDLFREYCSNPEIVELQEQTRQRIARTKAELGVVQDAMEQARRQHLAAKNDYEEREGLKGKFIALRDQEQFRLVAHYLELADELESAKKKANSREKEHIELRQRKTEQQGIAKKAKSEAEIHEKQRDTERKKMDTLQERLEAHDKEAMEARLVLARIKKSEDRLTELRKVPATDKLEEQRSDLDGKRQERTKRAGALESRLADLRHSIRLAKEHGLPSNVQACMEELKAKKLKVEPAWEFLPRNGPQGYEEAVGRNRFGLLVPEARVEQVLAVMANHDYPGPVSSLSREDYTAHCATAKTTADGFTTTLGKYVVVHETPYLNKKLVDENLKTLKRLESQEEQDLKKLDQEIKELGREFDAVVDKLQEAKERDLLNEEKAEWPKLKKENQAIVTTNAELRAEFFQKQTWVTQLNEKAVVARQRQQAAEEVVKAIDLELGKDVVGSELESQVQEALLACEPFLEARRADCKSEQYHTNQVRGLKRDTDGREEPSNESLADLQAQVEGLSRTIVDLQGKLGVQEEELGKSQTDLERVVQESLAHEDRAFKQVKKNIEALGDRFSCPTRLTRRQRDDKWLLDYEVANRSDEDGELVFRPVKNSSDSTGEGVKACMIFLMGLSQPDQSLFYIFDEPAKNFSDDNIIDMFRIFQHTRSQVIVTSAQRLDYGDSDLVIKQVFLQAQAKGTPNRKALPARHNLYGTIPVTA